MVLTSEYCARPYSPNSRPIPLCLKPPKGTLASSTSSGGVWDGETMPRTQRLHLKPPLTAVDPDGARAQPCGDGEGRVEALSEHSACEAKQGVVAALDDLLERLELEHAHNGSEDLLLGCSMGRKGGSDLS